MNYSVSNNLEQASHLIEVYILMFMIVQHNYYCLFVKHTKAGAGNWIHADIKLDLVIILKLLSGHKFQRSQMKHDYVFDYCKRPQV